MSIEEIICNPVIAQAGMDNHAIASRVMESFIS